MKSGLVALLVAAVSGAAYGGTADNISACVQKAREFAGVQLNEFDAVYKGNILSMSVATWPNAVCEVKLGSVYNLRVNGKELIVEGFAGRDSLELNSKLQGQTDQAIQQLRSRIALLEQRMDQATESLKKPKPDHSGLSAHIASGVEQARGAPCKPGAR